MKNRKNHHLLSTEVCRGIYNSPKNPNTKMEVAIKSVPPLSQEERDFISNTKRERYLKTATGIPTAGESVSTTTERFLPLPPLKPKVKPQVKRIVYISKSFILHF